MKQTNLHKLAGQIARKINPDAQPADVLHAAATLIGLGLRMKSMKYVAAMELMTALLNAADKLVSEKDAR